MGKAGGAQSCRYLGLHRIPAGEVKVNTVVQLNRISSKYTKSFPILILKGEMI